MIPLSRGLFTIIDDGDFKKVSKFKWFTSVCNGKFYATTHIKNETIRLHRFVTKAKKGFDVDHKNSVTLDNRKSNLRVCTHSENLMNRKSISSNNTSGFRGVTWSKNARKWDARLMKNYKHIYLGLFKTKKEAALAYDKAALEHFGEFANLNFPKSSHSRNRTAS